MEKRGEGGASEDTHYPDEPYLRPEPQSLSRIIPDKLPTKSSMFFRFHFPRKQQGKKREEIFRGGLAGDGPGI